MYFKWFPGSTRNISLGVTLDKNEQEMALDVAAGGAKGASGQVGAGGQAGKLMVAEQPGSCLHFHSVLPTSPFIILNCRSNSLLYSSLTYRSGLSLL